MRFFLGPILAIIFLNWNSNRIYPELEISPKKIELGSVEKGKDFYYKILIKNVSNLPVKIKSVIGDCGCLVLRWPQNPIKVNAVDTIYGSIKILEATSFRKTIMIHTNSRKGFYLVRIYGNGIVN